MIEVKIYDWKTPFNNVPVTVINKEWEKQYGGHIDIALVYKDGEFTGIAEPMGVLTAEEVAARYEAYFNQGDRDASLQTAELSPEERIAAALEFQNLMSL